MALFEFSIGSIPFSIIQRNEGVFLEVRDCDVPPQPLDIPERGTRYTPEKGPYYKSEETSPHFCLVSSDDRKAAILVEITKISILYGVNYPCGSDPMIREPYQTQTIKQLTKRLTVEVGSGNTFSHIVESLPEGE